MRLMSTKPERGRNEPPYRPDVMKLVRGQNEESLRPTREEQLAGFRGWHERGYLPHRDEPGLTQFVTFRLVDSVPADLRDEWEKLLRIEDDSEWRTEIEAWLDLGLGDCHLKDERIASLVADALRHFDGDRYRLKAWTIMPNHVHVLFQTHAAPMARVLQSWKQFTGARANRLLGQAGAFWQADYWDTYMRDIEHERRTVRYIRNNPVKAGLTGDWKAWPWTWVLEEAE